MLKDFDVAGGRFIMAPKRIKAKQEVPELPADDQGINTSHLQEVQKAVSKVLGF